MITLLRLDEISIRIWAPTVVGSSSRRKVVSFARELLSIACHGLFSKIVLMERCYCLPKRGS